MRAAASLCVELGALRRLRPAAARASAARSRSTRRSAPGPRRTCRIAVSDPDGGPCAAAGPERRRRPLGDRRASACRPSVRRLRAGSFLITPTGSRRAAAFRVSGCFGLSGRRGEPSGGRGSRAAA